MQVHRVRLLMFTATAQRPVGQRLIRWNRRHQISTEIRYGSVRYVEQHDRGNKLGMKCKSSHFPVLRNMRYRTSKFGFAWKCVLFHLEFAGSVSRSAGAGRRGSRAATPPLAAASRQKAKVLHEKMTQRQRGRQRPAFGAAPPPCKTLQRAGGD